MSNRRTLRPKNKEAKVQIKKLVIGVLMVTLLISFFSMGPGVAAEKPVIAYVPKGTAASYWKVVHAGTKAGAGPDYEVVMIGPPHETRVEGQIDIVQDMIRKKVAGILLIATDTEALIGPTKDALAAGIPLITLDSGVNSDDPLTYIATDNVKASSLAAYKLAELMGYQGKALFVNFFAGSATAAQRAEGFLKTIAEFPDIELIGPKYSGQSVEGAMNVVADVLKAHPDLGGIFGAEEKTAVGCARQVELEDLAIPVVGFDANETEQDFLKKGVMDSLVVQQPWVMGFQAAKTLVGIIEGRIDPKELPEYQETPVVVATQQNMNLPAVKKALLQNLGIVE